MALSTVLALLKRIGLGTAHVKSSAGSSSRSPLATQLRLAYAEVVANEQAETAAASLRRAATWFASFGINLKRNLTARRLVPLPTAGARPRSTRHPRPPTHNLRHALPPRALPMSVRSARHAQQFMARPCRAAYALSKTFPSSIAIGLTAGQSERPSSVLQHFLEWAVPGSNQRPPACKHSQWLPPDRRVPWSGVTRAMRAPRCAARPPLAQLQLPLCCHRCHGSRVDGGSRSCVPCSGNCGPSWRRCGRAAGAGRATSEGCNRIDRICSSLREEPAQGRLLALRSSELRALAAAAAAACAGR
jgi:hypothetical protein